MAPAQKKTASVSTKATRKETTPPKQRKKDDDPEALFIPAGVLLGLGFGFVFDNIVAGLFLGLGIGFLIFAFLSVMKRRN